MDLVDQLWPQLERATAWIERRIDDNPYGLLAYSKTSENGLTNQGWKDSGDSIFHADGTFPPPPIALVEVQGYAFAAFRTMARLATRRGDREAAQAWADRAETMRRKVEEMFWMEEAGGYGLAVDGEGRLARVRASNMGHLLFSGLPSRERAARVTQTLLGADFSSGWGLRTLAVGEARYNPMSYHNGSVWPHDTAICAAGMANYGERRGVARVMSDMYKASRAFGLRMPELLCGFDRHAGEPPVAYPVTCMPQAWSAASVFLMLQACLGLTIDARRREVRVVRPFLPHGIDTLSVERLDVAGATVNLVFQRLDGSTVVGPGHGSDRSVSVLLER
jgi:glycogen debranching enzyme